MFSTRRTADYSQLSELGALYRSSTCVPRGHRSQLAQMSPYFSLFGLRNQRMPRLEVSAAGMWGAHACSGGERGQLVSFCERLRAPVPIGSEDLERCPSSCSAAVRLPRGHRAACRRRGAALSGSGWSVGSMSRSPPRRRRSGPKVWPAMAAGRAVQLAHGCAVWVLQGRLRLHGRPTRRVT